MLLDFLAEILSISSNEDFKTTFRMSRVDFFRQFNRLVLFLITESAESLSTSDSRAVDILSICITKQEALFDNDNNDSEFLRCLLHHLYAFLMYEGWEKLRALSITVSSHYMKRISHDMFNVYLNGNPAAN